jgi:hypothetical protein
MNDDELIKVLSAFDSRITTINDRTKAHTIDIKNIEKRLKELEVCR